MTPRQKAEELLAAHGGACSVRKDSTFAAIFEIMRLEGSVTTRVSGTPGYIDVYEINFKSRFEVKYD